jgi:hypothetical protein
MLTHKGYRDRFWHESFAHAVETWDWRSVAQMYVEAMRLTPNPHPFVR